MPKVWTIAGLAAFAALTGVGIQSTVLPSFGSVATASAPASTAATGPTRPTIPLPERPKAPEESTPAPGPAQAPAPPAESFAIEGSETPILQRTADESDVLGLTLSPGARVSATARIERGIYRLWIVDQDLPLGAQLASARVAGLQSFSLVPEGRGAYRIDLRVLPGIRGARVERPAAGRLTVRLGDRPFPGGALGFGLDAAPDEIVAAHQPAVESIAGATTDRALLGLLLAPLERPAEVVEWPPILWPIGRKSPVIPALESALIPLLPAPPPESVRAAWAQEQELQLAVTAAEAGKPKECIFRLRTYQPKSDQQAALLALARAWAWSLPAAGWKEPLEPGRAADAAQLAAALDPKAPWVDWARGLAGYAWEREHRLDEGMVQYAQAGAATQDSERRAYWNTRRAALSLQGERSGPGLLDLARWLGGLPAPEDLLRFEARRAAAIALWRGGDAVRAAAVVDLIRAEHPALASEPHHDESWGVLYLHGGRASAALPFLQRAARTAERSQPRERARWWLHEAALSLRDADGARRALLELQVEAPRSVLRPMARARLAVLDHLLQDGKGGTGRAELIQKLERTALAHPDTRIASEALSFVGQLYLSLDLFEDGLQLYRWLEDRHAGSAAAYEEVVCRYAPQAFHILRLRGDTTRAIGTYRTFLDTPKMHLCSASEAREEAAHAALAAGLPQLGARWLGQAIAEGTDPTRAGQNLVQLANLYVADGRLEAADQTLAYVEKQGYVVRPGDLDTTRGDLHRARREHAPALASYQRALQAVLGSARAAGASPLLRWREGEAHEALGQHELALVAWREALEQGGAPDAGLGWARYATLRAETAATPVQWQATLSATERALAETLDETLVPTMLSLRAESLAHLGRTAEASETATGLSSGSDAWALLARERLGALDFERQLDEKLSKLPSLR